MNTFFYYYLLWLLAYLVTVLVLYAASIKFPLAGFGARCLAGYASLIVCALYGVFASLILRLVGYQGLSQWTTARAFKFCMKYAAGVTFVIEDPDNYLNDTRPAVIIGNHQTELDVLMLACVFPKWCSVTAKKSLKNWPFLGWFMALSGTVFIDRANSSSARNAMSGAAKEIKGAKQSVYMFPEGTRSYSKEPMLLPFKKGAFHLALQAGVPILPVVVANYADVLFVQGYKFRSGTILCKVLKPIQTSHLTPADVEDLTRDTRELMLHELTNLTVKQRGKPMAMASQDTKEWAIKASGADSTIAS